MKIIRLAILAALAVAPLRAQDNGPMKRLDEAAMVFSEIMAAPHEGISVGFQIGGSQADLILLVMNERGVDKLLSSKFTLGAASPVRTPKAAGKLIALQNKNSARERKGLSMSG